MPVLVEAHKGETNKDFHFHCKLERYREMCTTQLEYRLPYNVR